MLKIDLESEWTLESSRINLNTFSILEKIITLISNLKMPKKSKEDSCGHCEDIEDN